LYAVRHLHGVHITATSVLGRRTSRSAVWECLAVDLREETVKWRWRVTAKHIALHNSPCPTLHKPVLKLQPGARSQPSWYPPVLDWVRLLVLVEPGANQTTIYTDGLFG
jgi:hypothetical protein